MIIVVNKEARVDAKIISFTSEFIRFDIIFIFFHGVHSPEKPDNPEKPEEPEKSHEKQIQVRKKP